MTEIQLDLNNPAFQQKLFDLENKDLVAVRNTLKKLLRMTWEQLYMDRGLRWEKVLSSQSASGRPRYTFRCSQKIRAVARRDGDFLRLLGVYPDHDSAYR